MKIKMGLLIFAMLWLTACDTRVHEPWVQNPNYLKQERSVSPELNKRLEDRVYHQIDR